MPSTVPGACANRVAKNSGSWSDRVLLDVALDVRGDVFDADPAAELLAEEGDVAADDRSEIDQHRVLAGLQAREELRQRLRGMTELGLAVDGVTAAGAGSAARRSPGSPNQSVIGERIRPSRRRGDRQAPTFCAGAGAVAAGVARRRCASWRRRGRRGRRGRPAGWPAGLAPARCMSTLPRKCAPSAMATRGEVMSPSTEPLSRISTFSRRRHVADDLAQDDDRLGEHLGRILPLGPMVSMLSRSSIRPSTCPRWSDPRCRSAHP